jgi:putative RNA 2'-phosphotransferase
MATDGTQLSKFLSYVLRHKPESIQLRLDEQGWANVEELIANSANSGTSFTREDLVRVVATNDKKRFSLSEDGRRIRAAQGHSVEVALGLASQIPPDLLYHGTATRFLDSILAQGLKPQSRQQVHLSSDHATALRVGQRHGTPVVLQVMASAMQREGSAFFQADNGVWLTDEVPPRFLRIAPSLGGNEIASQLP